MKDRNLYENESELENKEIDFLKTVDLKNIQNYELEQKKEMGIF